MFPLPRRRFLRLAGTAACGWSAACAWPESLGRTAQAVAAEDEATGTSAKHPPLTGQVGLTTGSFMKHLSATPAAGKLVLLDLPRIMRDELDLTVLDLMTACFPSLSADYCAKLRSAAEQAGCIITNLKMNQKEIDLASADPAQRQQALEVYCRTIDAAEQLGCRWVRPATGSQKPDLTRWAEGMRRLIDYARPKGISLLVENNGWMRDDPMAIPRIVELVGAGLACQPDTGNWTDRARYEGLEKAFPSAVSCDFKAFALGPNLEHADYDLRRCFDLGWAAGFRGPWCFEHFHTELKPLLTDMKRLDGLLRGWMGEKAASRT